jgi:hypothetical protein
MLGGALMTAVGWPAWRRSEHLSLLSPSERVAVIRAVQKGDPSPDPRLAPSVLAFAEVAISAARQERRQRSMFFGLPVLMIAVAVGWTVTGSARLAAYFWALTALLLVRAWLGPGRAEGRLKNAGEAARIAADQITGPGGMSC